MANVTAQPLYLCDCGRGIEFPGRRIGDTIDCPGCGAMRVIIRSKIDGTMPDPEALARNLSPEDREDVDQAHENIRQRREQHREQRADLFQTRWIFLLGLLGVYMAGILAAQNLSGLGKPQRGRRVLVLGVGSYLLFLLLVIYLAGSSPALAATLGLAYTFVGTLAVVNAVRHETAAGFLAGAKPLPVLLPGLFAAIVALVQFAVGRALLGSSSF